jgi:hypothetical protein
MTEQEQPLHVVYHVAAMGNWQEVVQEQFQVFRESGLKHVRLTHVGHGLDWLLEQGSKWGVNLVVVRSDENLHHCETLAMIEVERLAKAENTQKPILYCHTKGVSNPSDHHKQQWRRLMNEYVVRNWRDNLPHLHTHHAVGAVWRTGGAEHYTGNFWIASPVWIRCLPDFVRYHWANGGHRYTCETWIGSHQWCIAYSTVGRDQPIWDARFDFGHWLNYLPGKATDILDHCHYHGLVTHQLPGVFDVFPGIVADLKPARILEFGTAHGGFAIFLKHCLRRCDLPHVPVLSLDIKDYPGHIAARREGVDVRNMNVFAPDHGAIDPLVADFMGGPGPSLVLVDAQEKPKEFRAVAPHLKVGDVLMAHDYAPSADIFYERVRGKTWNWLEITDADVAACCEQHGLTPWRQDDLEPVVWKSVMKTGPSRSPARVAENVTVCIPTIPPRRYELIRALASVNAQTLRPSAVVVETDYTRRGSAETRNAALRAAKTEWVAFLDDDDEFFPDHIEELVAHQKETGADVVYSGGVVVDAAGNVLPERDEWGRFGKPFDPDEMRLYSYIQTTTLVRAELAVAAGGFRFPAGTTYDDWGLFLAMLDRGAKFSHLPKKTWRWNHHGANTGGQGDRW